MADATLPVGANSDACVRMVALTSDALAALSAMDDGCEVRALLLLKQAAALGRGATWQAREGDTWKAKAGLHTAFAEVYAWIGDAKDLERAQAKFARQSSGVGGFTTMGGLESAELKDPSKGGSELQRNGDQSKTGVIDTRSAEEGSSSDPFGDLVSSDGGGGSEQEFNARAFESFKAPFRKRSFAVVKSYRPESEERILRGSLDSAKADMGRQGTLGNLASGVKISSRLVAPYQTAAWWYEKSRQELAKAYQLHADANHPDKRASLAIFVRMGDLFGRLAKDESAASCYVAAAALSTQLGSDEAQEVRDEILYAAWGLKTKCGRAVLASFPDAQQYPAGLSARALLCMREGRYKEAEVAYLRLLELMRDRGLADADTLLLAKVMLQALLRGQSLRTFLHATDGDDVSNSHTPRSAAA
ncbi:hypothetical protein KFL_000070200 [Klebsormidium nitens]|uniref:Uncharacterized protein n=1 Tax=Klebsormidium nitens TaxID=105231 RepID=A0A1Y1HHY4_KLENI|nr:hypothetical protein KFL_000070200 [Klebsormidium nitens]|eukprot:GAQ78050.1 hypothetical protein KFL_000070200 [Klebsormidium nitens]